MKGRFLRMNKLAIPAILVIFALWIILQLVLGGNVFKNPLNYCILITVFFLFIKQATERK